MFFALYKKTCVYTFDSSRGGVQYSPHTVVLRRKITMIIIMFRRINGSIGKN